MSPAMVAYWIWHVMSLLENRTVKRYFGVLYLFLSCVVRRRRAR